LGAFVGAAIFEVVKLAASAYMAGVWQLLLGMTLLLVIVVAPEGIIGALEKRKSKKQGGPA
jgi:branched-chain amino acid transport system permease protein